MNFQYWQDISFYLNEIDKEKNAFSKAHITPDSLVARRKNIGHLVEQLKSDLEQKISKDHVSLILFAIVAGVDEQMQSFDYNHLKVRWVPLQKDFYSAYTAGEVFFRTIDEILENPTIPPLVHEVFYYILKRGFQGKYRDSKTQLQKYMDLLKDKIPAKVLSQKTPLQEEVAPAKSNFKPWHYYALGALCCGVLYFALYALSNLDRY
jgi:type IV/VI secretion system ImpK/VasF family protein